MGDRTRDTRRPLIVGGILLAAALLRAIGLGFGLPAVYNPDEIAIMNRAVALGQNGLNPHNFLYPTFYFYVLFAWEGALFAAGFLAGRFDSLAAFEREFFTDPTIFYLAGRCLSVVCGVAAVWATWRLGDRLFGRRAGLAAAALLAVAPLAVRDAHYVKHDVPVTLLVVLTHLALATQLDRRHARRWWPAAVCAGLALSTHYYAVFLLLPLAIVTARAIAPDEPAGARLRRTMAALAVAGVVFLAASPFLVVEPGTVHRDVVANRQIVVDRATDSGGAFASLMFYVEWLAGDASGRVAAELAAGGLAVVWRTGSARAALTLVFPVVFVLFMANTVPASRYLNPVLPFMAIAGGAAVSWMSGQRRAWQLAGALLVAAAVGEAALASARGDVFFARSDTRTLALAWIETHLPPETSILVQPYSVPLRSSRAALVEALTHHLGSADRASVKFQRQLGLEPYPSPAYRAIYLGSGGLDVDRLYVDPSVAATSGLAPLRALGITHVVMKRYNVEDPSMAPLMRALEDEGRLEATFSPYRTDASPAQRRAVAPFQHNTDARIDRALERPGPIIDIWNID